MPAYEVPRLFLQFLGSGWMTGHGETVDFPTNFPLADHTPRIEPFSTWKKFRDRINRNTANQM